MIETDGIAVLRGKSDEPSVIKQIDDFAWVCPCKPA